MRDLTFALIACAVLARTGQSHELSRAAVPAATFDVSGIRDRVLPSACETAFLRVRWLNGFAKGLAAARALGRPLLLYAMNGHPQGFT